jgi:hypothetical protein
MGILRTDIVSHSQLEGSGSVELDGVGDYLTFASHSAFTARTSDVTFELWVYLTDSTDLSNGNYYLFDMGSNGYRLQIYQGTLYFGDGSNTTSGSGITKNAWHHVAGIRDGGAKKLYLDGNLINQNACSVNHSTDTLTIGSYSTGGGDYEPYGYISNFRYVRGVVYKDNFTPPKFELKNIPGTIVLGCQSTTSATDFAVTPSTVTANGDAAASAFHPGLKKDITDTGVVFDGVTTFDSQAFMVPPSGKTTERNRGRGIFADGDASKTIEFINIQSMGNAQDFGDSTTDYKQRASVSSSTRTVTGGGFSSPNFTNILDFITIASTSNATDFGDLTLARRNLAGAGNNTRGIFYGGGSPSATNTIDFITIATTGDASDFGDATVVDQGAGSFASSTRAVFGGGLNNTIEFVTIATTGNASDFGDLISGQTEKPAGASSSTRGLFICGESQPAGTRLNTIQFVTIATTGNATDFGDNTFLLRSMGACTNSLRAVYGGGNDPSATLSTLSFVTIATTGNGQDFGDLIGGRSVHACGSSDSHGGIE